MDTDKGVIFSIRQQSTQDGPGTRTVVLFKGCAMCCQWCHSPEGQSPAPELLFYEERCNRCGECIQVCARNAVYEDAGRYYTVMEHCTLCKDCLQICKSNAREIAGEEFTVPEMMSAIELSIPESGDFAGITFSGGEPMLQSAFLLDLLKACKEKGLHTALDTCGCAPWEAFDSVRAYVDLFLYDIKLVDDHRHQRFTCVSNQSILDNIKRLAELGHQITVRVPLIPGITDDEKNLHEVGEFIAALPGVHNVNLLPFRGQVGEKYDRLGRNYQLKNTLPQSPDTLTHQAKLLANYGLNVTILN